MENKDYNIYDCKFCLYSCMPCIALFMACENLFKCICCFSCYLDCKKDKTVIPESFHV